MKRMHADRDKLIEAEFEVRTEVRPCIEAIVCGHFTPRWKVLEAEICVILLPLMCVFAWYDYLLKSNFSVFGQIPWVIVRRFDRN